MVRTRAKHWGLLALVSAVAVAHPMSASTSELTLRGDLLEARIHLAAGDFEGVLPLQRDPSGALKPEQPSALNPAIIYLIVDAISIARAAEPCQRSHDAPTVSVEPPDGMQIVARWNCPPSNKNLILHFGFVERLAPGHTHFVKVVLSNGELSEHVVQAASETFEVQVERRWREEAARFLRLGVEHIFTGYDHIAFLIGLLLLGGTLKRLIQIVTSFTLAHSITLALATLGVLAPSPRLIEPLIAASIVFVAAENLWALRAGKTEQALRHRWRLTFGFGLIHGFGFASVLRALELPQSSLAASLVTFNLGVEVGQVCIVSLAFPLLRGLRMIRGFDPLGTRVLSVAVGLLGMFWLLQRVATG